MSYITWKTKAGKLGTIKEQEFADILLLAQDSDQNPLEFRVISGSVPPGMRVTSTGIFQGIPQILGANSSGTATSTFTVRATTPQGVIADRTFSMAITNQTTLSIFPRVTSLGIFDDGKYFSRQFTTLPERPGTQLRWSIVSGELPLDIRTGVPITLSKDGLLSGNIARLIDASRGTPGYDVEPDERFPYDFAPTSTNKVYAFQIQVSDGVAYDIVTCYINVISRSSYTADSLQYSADNSLLTTDSDNKYVPVIITDLTTIPVLQAGNNFSFKFLAIDPSNDAISWSGVSLPGNLSLNPVTGWLTGVMPAQTEVSKIYSFGIQAFKRDDPRYLSGILSVQVTVLKDANNYVTWSSAAKLGTIINGTVSDLAVVAVSNANKQLVYTKLNLPSSKLPQGLRLMPDGNISGRASFQFFRLDGNSSNITVDSTTGVEVGMTVEGSGVASGSKVLSVVSQNQIQVTPAIYVSEGNQITFIDLLTTNNIVTTVTSLSSSTSIDNDTTTFDSTYTFTASVQATDQSVSAVKEFTIFVDNYNRAPYENVYLKALPLVEQRQLFLSIVNNQEIFPPELIYRATDPWFGRSKDMRMLFLPGLTSASLETLASAVNNNHYNKRINFGNVRTARALDNNSNTIYEVVYIQVEDPQSGVALSLDPVISNFYTYNGESYYTLYPNSFGNMEYRLASGVGFTNKGALPRWMTSQQENGRVLGLTRGVVLAYTVPGASKLIAYRIANNNINFNNIDFVADRYQLDNSMSDNFNLSTNTFDQGRETIFDGAARVISDLVYATVLEDTDTNLVTLDPQSVKYDPASPVPVTLSRNVGYGWRVRKFKVSNRSQVSDSVTITGAVVGNLLILNQAVSLRAGDSIVIDGAAAVTYATSTQFDSIDGQYMSRVLDIDRISSYSVGDTILFTIQESRAGTSNDGWNQVEWVEISGLLAITGPNDNNPLTIAAPYYTQVPGYTEKENNPGEINQRAGIWRITVDLSGIIKLVFVQEVMLGQTVRVIGGTSFPGSFLLYDPVLYEGANTYKYTPQVVVQNTSKLHTTFDNNGTRYFSNKDIYAVPEAGDRYIKWGKTNVYV
jgi:hypothetical protein